MASGGATTGKFIRPSADSLALATDSRATPSGSTSSVSMTASADSRLRATGPFTIMTCIAPPVVAAVPARLNPSRMAARTPATTTGKCSGLHPAITALMASFSKVARELRGCITPSGCWGSASMDDGMSRTESSVGGTTGSPSVQPCSQK